MRVNKTIFFPLQPYNGKKVPEEFLVNFCLANLKRYAKKTRCFLNGIHLPSIKKDYKSGVKNISFIKYGLVPP